MAVSLSMRNLLTITILLFGEESFASLLGGQSARTTLEALLALFKDMAGSSFLVEQSSALLVLGNYILIIVTGRNSLIVKSHPLVTILAA